MSHDSGELRRTLESLRDRPDELVGIILRQSGRISRLEAESASLRRELESLRNQPPRPAAPFRIKEHKRQSNPKRPGRKPGHEGSCRQAPK